MMNNQKFYKEVGIPVAKKGVSGFGRFLAFDGCEEQWGHRSSFRGWHGGRVLGD